MTDNERIARLERALEYGGGTHALSDVVQLLRDGKAQWWQSGDGMIVSEVHAFPRMKAVHYWLIAGELRQCLALERDIDAWAVEQGCTMATACGRRGWGRVAAPSGWRPQPHMWNFYKPLGEYHGQ